MRLFIEPAEPLLLRTGRPFDAGQNNFAESMFPPTPETLQGAVRATIAAHWDQHKNIATAFGDPDLTRLIGDYSGYGRFRMTGIALGRYSKSDREKTVERLFRPPAHLRQKEKDERIFRLFPRELGKVRSNLPDDIRYYLKPDDFGWKPLGGWLTETSLSKTLGKDELTSADIEIVRDGDVYQEEPRLGIGIELGTKATEEGYLYQMLMMRMNHKLEHAYMYGFVVDIDLASPKDEPLSDEQIRQELRLPTSGWMILGGEQRTAHFRVLPPPASVRIVIPARERTLLYLATPAYFKDGWKPSSGIAASQPITAAINGYDPIGGWKLTTENAGGENKVMRRCVRAGSVYFFNEKITLNQSLADDDLEKIGYGITFEGEW